MIGVVIGTLAVVGAAIAVGAWVTHRRGLVPRPDELAAPPKQRPAYAAGEAPATAIRAGAAQLERLRTTQRCTSCRAMMASTGEEHVRYGDGDMLVIDLRCERCGVRRPLYVVPAAATSTKA